MDSPAAAATTESPAQSDPGVSIVVPAYNYAQYLEAAVRSVLAQDYRPLEVIIVDDGSRDETPALGLRLAAETRLVRYVHQQNAGLSAARNTGIREARHPFVAFLDADDEWLPGMLSTVMAAYRSLPEDTGLVACSSRRVTAEGAPIVEKQVNRWGNRYFSGRELLMKTRFMPSCAVARRECFQEAGDFDTTLRSSEDRDMWARIGMNRRVYHVDQPLVNIRKHASNMSRHADRMRAAMRQVRRKARGAELAPAWRVDFWLPLAAIDHFQAGWMYWDEGRPARALFHAAASILVWPLPINHLAVAEPAFFRLRAALRFLLARRPTPSA